MVHFTLTSDAGLSPVMECLIILPSAADCKLYRCLRATCLIFIPLHLASSSPTITGSFGIPHPSWPPDNDVYSFSPVADVFAHQTLWRETLLISVSCLTHSCAEGAVHGQHHDSHSCFTAVHVPGQLNFFTNELHLVHMLQMLQTCIPLLALCHSLPASFLYSRAFEICLMFYLKLSNSPLSLFPLPAQIFYYYGNFTTPSFIHHCVLELWKRSPNVETLHKHFPSVKDNQKFH